MFDLIARGGEVLDGTGSAAFRADVGVRYGRIDVVGPLPGAQAAWEIDATGRYVAPGLVDAHVHADAAVLDPAVQLALLRQGVTTVVLGQDGLSYAPGSPSTVDFVGRYFAPVNGAHPGFPGGSVADLLATYDLATAVNTAYLVPHGTVRYEVMGPAPRAAGPDELVAMRRLVESGLADGAVGLSSGLEYAPGRYANIEELTYLCKALGGRPYVTHMRGYETKAPAGFAEAVEVGRRSRAPVHVSHLHGPARLLLDLLHRAPVDVSFDSYPYLRSSSTLALVTLPDWLPTADLDATIAALRDPAVRARLLALWPDELWRRITIACVAHPDWAWAQGLRLPVAAHRVGLSPSRLALELLLADELRVGCVFDHPPTNRATNRVTNSKSSSETNRETNRETDSETDSYESVRALLRHPAQMGSSDGIYRGGHPHPYGYGAFARLLGRHVRELRDWTWPAAVHHLADWPATRFGLAGRGLIRRGYVADLVIFDPATVADRATYDRPRTPAVGVADVVVGGVPVLANGALTGATTGRALR